MWWPGSAVRRKPPRRAPDDVTLVAVSKQQPWDAIAPVLAAGQTTFGENRVQEAQETLARQEQSGLTLLHPDPGPLQTNKAADAVAIFMT